MKASRRQLLKGSLAAPLVLTARPASAWALSSAASCKVKDWQKAQDYPGPAKLTNQAADEWLRVDCDLHKIKVYQKNKWTDISGKYFLGTDKATFWKVNDSTNPLSATKTSYTVSTCTASKTGERKYGLCFVDDNMSVVGYGWEPHGGKCISKSCWTSIKPHG